MRSFEKFFGLWVQITDLDMFSTAGCQNLVTVGK